MGKLATAFLFVLMLLPAVRAVAADTILNIKVTIIQCGNKSGMESACQADERCCAFMEPAASGEEDAALPDEAVEEGNSAQPAQETGAPLPLIGLIQQTYIME